MLPPDQAGTIRSSVLRQQVRRQVRQPEQQEQPEFLRQGQRRQRRRRNRLRSEPLRPLRHPRECWELSELLPAHNRRLRMSVWMQA